MSGANLGVMGESDTTPRALYIDMIKRCVLNIPYVDAEINPVQPLGR